jgi:uncharacterized protein
MDKKQERPSWLRLVLVGLVIYSACVLMLALLQRSLIYFPSRASAVVPANFGLPADRVLAAQITTDDGLTLHGWHVLPAGLGVDPSAGFDAVRRPEGPVILYFPGNAGHRGFRSDELLTLADLGAHVFLFDYRGYAENPGRPTETNLIRDARAAWRDLTDHRGIQADQIVLFGESLGGGVAVRLAADLCRDGITPGGLMLRSTFSSLADVAAYHYPWVPVRLLMIDRFESDQHIPTVACPILLIHGSRDTIVPIRFARKLFEAAPQQSASGIAKQFAELDRADHNDLPYVSAAEYRAAMAGFLETVFGPDKPPNLSL